MNAVKSSQNCPKQSKMRKKDVKKQHIVQKTSKRGIKNFKNNIPVCLFLKKYFVCSSREMHCKEVYRRVVCCREVCSLVFRNMTSCFSCVRGRYILIRMSQHVADLICSSYLDVKWKSFEKNLQVYFWIG